MQKPLKRRRADDHLASFSATEPDFPRAGPCAGSRKAISRPLRRQWRVHAGILCGLAETNPQAIRRRRLNSASENTQFTPLSEQSFCNVRPNAGNMAPLHCADAQQRLQNRQGRTPPFASSYRMPHACLLRASQRRSGRSWKCGCGNGGAKTGPTNATSLQPASPSLRRPCESPRRTATRRNARADSSSGPDPPGARYASACCGPSPRPPPARRARVRRP